MLRREITYDNPFTEEKVTEEHFFHISKADLVEMELEEHGEIYTNKDGEEFTGMQAKLQRVAESEDGKVILATFKDIIRRAYGKKEVIDGKERFIKSQQIADDFMASEAASQLVFEIATDPDQAATFVSSIVPGNLEQIAAEVQAQAERVAGERERVAAQNGASQPEGATLDRNAEILRATPENPVVLTSVEVNEMESAQLKNGIADGRYKFA